MKLLVLILIFTLVLFCSCTSSDYDEDDYEVQRSARQQRVEQDVQILQKKFELGKWCFGQQLFKQTRENFRELLKTNRSEVPSNVNYKDSVSTFYKKNIDILLVYNRDEIILTADEFNFDDARIFQLKDSIQLAKEEVERNARFNVNKERNWIYIGKFYRVGKDGVSSNYAYPVYYDINHLIYENNLCYVMLKIDFYSQYDFQYVSLNLIDKVVHDIDNSENSSGKSYNFLWDGDWAKGESDFGNELYRFVK